MDRRLFRSRIHILDLLSVLVLLVLLTGYLYNLTGWRIYDDEGEYLYQVWRMDLGDVPYRDFLTPQLPLFLYSGSAVMSLGGGQLWVMRLFSVLLAFGTATLLLVYGRRHHHRLTGLIAAVLFLLHSDVFRETRIFRNEPLFLFLVTAGLVFALWDSINGRRYRLLAAGIFFGLATLVKLFGLLPAGGVAAWLLWDTWKHKKRFIAYLVDIVWLFAPLVAVISVTTIIFSTAAPGFLDLVLGHHLEQGSGKGLLSVLADKLGLFLSYFRFNPLFIIVAIASGIFGLVIGDDRERWFWQLPTVIGFLVLSRELGQRHFMFLLPTMALLAGWLISWGFTAEFRWWARAISALVLIAIIFPWLGPNVDRAQWRDRETEKALVAISELSSEGASILADDIGLAFYSKRPTTYSGAALSHGAVTSGQITGEILISEIIEDNVELVIVDESLLTGNHMVFLRDYPRFHRFLESNFEKTTTLRRDFQELTFWSRAPENGWVAEDQLPMESEIADAPWFGDSIRLAGYTIENQTLSPGDRLDFTLFWQAEGPANNYWSVFTHLVAPDGGLISQHDKVPYDGLYPPDRWWPGQIIDDRYSMELPADIEPGDYEIILGMYDFITGDRLMLRSASGSRLTDDQYRLPATISIDHDSSGNR